MEVQPVVVPHFNEFDKIGHRVRGTSVKEVDDDVSCAGFHENLHDSTTHRHFKRICLFSEQPHLDSSWEVKMNHDPPVGHSL